MFPVIFGLALAAGIVLLTFLLLRLARPADFKSRPDASGAAVEELLPPNLGAFWRVDLFEPGEERAGWQATYEGLEARIELTIRRADSPRGAMQMVGRLQRGRGSRVVIAAQLGGNHSYLVRKSPRKGSPTGRIIAWTNGEMVFAAWSARPAQLREFVVTYPF